MRAALIALVLVLGLSEARAQEARPPDVKLPAHLEPHIKQITVPQIDIQDAPPVRPGPSGYWTGYRPARHGAYRWTMLGIAAALLGLTLLLVLRLLRRATAQNRSRAAATSSSGSSVAPS